jgi:hypothetical protein
MSGVKYSEGDWFAVPLRAEGFAVGLVARANPKMASVLGYFFGPRRTEMPRLVDVLTLTPSDAVLVGKISHLGVTDGLWPIIGRFPGWSRAEWPMPVFVRYEELTGRTFRVYYADDDPMRLVREVEIEPGVTEHGHRDGSMGAGYVETKLTKLLE